VFASDVSVAVLVVEDHSAYRALMGQFLRILKLDHEMASDGVQGLIAMERRHFDLVISDCQMPNMNGYAMAREVRLREHQHGHRRVPIIALTANLMHDDPQRCRDAGMDAWLAKPLSLEQLEAVLLRWLPEASSYCMAAAQPTRAGLIKLFGSAAVVDQMLALLLQEARDDSVTLAHAQLALDPGLTSERLHRLVGSLAFLGCTELESQGALLIEQVRAYGVAGNRSGLETFQRDLSVYLAYLGKL